MKRILMFSLLINGLLLGAVAVLFFLSNKNEAGGNQALSSQSAPTHSHQEPVAPVQWTDVESDSTAVAVAKPATGNKPGSPPQGSAASPVRIARPAPVIVPLALLEPDPSIIADQTQRNAWQNMQDAFINSVGGEYQNPNDPAYYEKWKKAQEDLDEAFHAQFGDDAFNIMTHKRHVTQFGNVVTTQ